MEDGANPQLISVQENPHEIAHGPYLQPREDRVDSMLEWMNSLGVRNDRATPTTATMTYNDYDNDSYSL